MHRTGKAIADFKMIASGDRVMVCLSGGKDSFTLVRILYLLQQRKAVNFDLFVFTLDQGQPGWYDQRLREWLERYNLPYQVLTKDTYSIVTNKIPEGSTYCSLCSRLRRGIIYSYADEHGFKKIALGHHRDDVINTLLMSICYSGSICAMPPKLLTDNRRHIVIRPLIYCQEEDIIQYANEQAFPIIPCNLCGSQENLMRKKMHKLISELARDNPKVPSNMLHAVSKVSLSQLMDQDLFDFRNLEDQLIS